MVIATWPDSGETASQAFRTTLATARSRRLALYQPMVDPSWRCVMVMRRNAGLTLIILITRSVVSTIFPIAGRRGLALLWSIPASRRPVRSSGRRTNGFLRRTRPVPFCLNLTGSETPHLRESRPEEYEGRETFGPRALFKEESGFLAGGVHCLHWGYPDGNKRSLCSACSNIEDLFS